MCEPTRNGLNRHDAAWRREVRSWIYETLNRIGYSVAGKITAFEARPWSIVLCVPIEGSRIWFKANGASLRHEGELLRLLGEWTGSAVPSPLALDTERGWMLLPDAGVSLADTLKSDKDIRHWEAALRNYGALQFTLNTRAQSLLAVGIPDQRPEIDLAWRRTHRT